MEPTTQPPEASTAKADSGIGAIVGSIIVVLIIILGAFYLFTTVQERRSGADDMNTETSQTNATDDTATPAELEAELESIRTDDLDAELADIEAAF